MPFQRKHIISSFINCSRRKRARDEEEDITTMRSIANTAAGKIAEVIGTLART